MDAMMDESGIVFSHSEVGDSSGVVNHDHRKVLATWAALWQFGGSTATMGLACTWTASLLSFQQRTFQTWPASHHAPPTLSLNTTLAPSTSASATPFQPPRAADTHLPAR